MRYHNRQSAQLRHTKRNKATQMMDRGMRLPDVAKRLNVSMTTLYKWRKEALHQKPRILTVVPKKTNKLTLSMGEFVIEIARNEREGC